MLLSHIESRRADAASASSSAPIARCATSEGQAVQLPSVALDRSASRGGDVGAAARRTNRSRSSPSRVCRLVIVSSPGTCSRAARVSPRPISLPDVFVPACLTPGTTALLVVHNHPSGDPTPSPDDARLTVRLAQAADVLDMPLLDHLIVGDGGRYFSFREAGLIGGTPSNGEPRMTRRSAITRGDSRAPFGAVKPLRCAPTPSGWRA